MATFTLTAQYQGREVQVTWTDGVLSGDASAVDAIASLAAAEQGKPLITPAGITRYNHLRDPYSAIRLTFLLLGPRARFVPEHGTWLRRFLRPWASEIRRYHDHLQPGDFL